MFTSSFASQDQGKQEFEGMYSVDGNDLALERNGAGSLIAEVKSAGAAIFNFKLIGAPLKDSGLDFSK